MALLTDEHLLVAIDVRRLVTDTDPDELVVPAESEERLHWIADWLTPPLPIFKEWGLQRYIDSGLRVLFRGPPGTGKTMAATSLGRFTDRPVFAVDVGTIVSTYVAETQKNLQRLFEAAREEGAILLFDEADALFGERLAVEEARATHVNGDIAYLLRQIELFEGLAIITADVDCALDQHALSRIDLIVEFPLPDRAARELLWRKTMASVKVPMAEDFDPAKLAEHELSGAEILRCARLATVLAVTTERQLNMELLQYAAAERAAMRAPPSR
jgi:SpoVK/Ycf46/Vps4 family AAA+-type ATPase